LLLILLLIFFKENKINKNNINNNNNNNNNNIKKKKLGKEAIDSGARCLCFHTIEESQILDLFTLLSKYEKNGKYGGITNGYHYTAKLRPEEDFSAYSEIG
jgi:hypothetical protein